MTSGLLIEFIELQCVIYVMVCPELAPGRVPGSCCINVASVLTLIFSGTDYIPSY